jgi:hypothetical protein
MKPTLMIQIILNSQMKTPCNDCPFRKALAQYGLSEAKAKDIIHAITHDGSFYCHKTTDRIDNIRPTLCIGSVRFLENNVVSGCRANVMYRLAIRRGEFQVSDLVTDAEVYGSIDEFLAGVTS